jgi:HEAT repeat protein
MDDIPAEAVSTLTQVLRESGGDYGRMLAANALGKVTGSAAAEAVSAVKPALSDVDLSVRSCAAVALGKIGPAAAEAVPELIKALRDDARVAVNAAQALWLIGLRAVPALIEALGDLDPRVRGCAAGALGKIGPAAAEAVPALIGALRDDAPNSLFVAQTLWTTWTWAAEDVPALVEAFRDNPRVAASAALALWQIGQPAIAALTEALRATDIQKQAETVLTGIGSTSRKTGRQPSMVPPVVAPGPAGSTQYAVFPDGSKIELPEFRQRKP